MMTSCVGRKQAIFIKPGTVGITAKWERDVKVFVPNKEGDLVPAVADLPPGTAVKIPKEEER